MFKRFPFINNHGDFVHLDALREWFRGVVSLETFLKSKDDKAIVKDMNFTDERTTVDYIDTKDDTEKTETLCEYLTSDVYDKSNSNQFNKVDKITVVKDSRGENWINMREKATQEQRLGVIRSNVPVAYDATDDFSTSQNRSAYLGITNRSINIFNDDTLKVYKKYWFANPIAYDVVDDNYASAKKSSYFSVNDNGIVLYDNNTFQKMREYNFKNNSRVSANIIETTLDDCNPFGGCSNLANHSPINFTKQTNFFATKIDEKVVSGQIVYRFIDEISVSAGKSVTLQFTPATMGESNFSKNVYPKNVRCHADNMDNNAGVISSLHYDQQGGFPTENTLPIRVTVLNPNETDIRLDTVLFTF